MIESLRKTPTKSPIRALIDRKRQNDLVVEIDAGVLPRVPQRQDHKALWASYLDTARSYLPAEIRGYLTITDIDVTKKPPKTLAESPNFYLVEESIAPIRVLFTTGGGMSYFEVPSLGTRASGFDWFWETASVFENLLDALVAADDRYKERQAFKVQAEH